MADDPDDPQEGWQVPFRLPALVALAVPLVLFAVVAACALWFNATVRPETFRKPQPFPAPGLDTGITPATVDPEAAAPRHREDPAIARAKREVVERGIPGWGQTP